MKVAEDTEEPSQITQEHETIQFKAYQDLETLVSELDMYDVPATQVEFVDHIRDQLNPCGLPRGAVESENNIANTHSPIFSLDLASNRKPKRSPKAGGRLECNACRSTFLFYDRLRWLALARFDEDPNRLADVLLVTITSSLRLLGIHKCDGVREPQDALSIAMRHANELLSKTNLSVDGAIARASEIFVDNGGEIPYATFKPNFYSGWAHIRKNMHSELTSRVTHVIDNECWKAGECKDSGKVKISADGVFARLEEMQSQKIIRLSVAVASEEGLPVMEAKRSPGSILMSLMCQRTYLSGPSQSWRHLNPPSHQKDWQ